MVIDFDYRGASESRRRRAVDLDGIGDGRQAPDVNWMTPATEKSISSAVVSALTLVIAARSEPAPESPRLETVYVVGVSLVSSDSRRGRKVGRERRRDTVFFMESL